MIFPLLYSSLESFKPLTPSLPHTPVKIQNRKVTFSSDIKGRKPKTEAEAEELHRTMLSVHLALLFVQGGEGYVFDFPRFNP